MTEKLLETVIVGAPNFIFAMIAIFVLYRRLASKDALILYLLKMLETCEREEDAIEKLKAMKE